MIAATLKALTWATLTTAVISAILLAATGTSMPRLTGLVDEARHGRPASAAQEGVDASNRKGPLPISNASNAGPH